MFAERQSKRNSAHDCESFRAYIAAHRRRAYHVRMPDDKPLISPRSPSYDRARREREHPAPPGDDAVIAVLARLVELEHDAARAVVAAAGDPADHLLRARAVGDLIEGVGGSPPRPEESRELLANGAAEVARSDDPEAVLRRMRAELAAAYEEAAREPLLTDEQRAALRRMA
jgi:hypothetical protein